MVYRFQDPTKQTLSPYQEIFSAIEQMIHQSNENDRNYCTHCQAHFNFVIQETSITSGISMKQQFLARLFSLLRKKKTKTKCFTLLFRKHNEIPLNNHSNFREKLL